MKRKFTNGNIKVGEALDALEALPAIYIKQKFEWIEAACGIETPNSYKVYAADKNGNMQGT